MDKLPTSKQEYLDDWHKAFDPSEPDIKAIPHITFEQFDARIRRANNGRSRKALWRVPNVFKGHIDSCPRDKLWEAWESLYPIKKDTL